MNCPICKTPVADGSSHCPFCSERCKLLDLGNWASERYIISSPAPADPEPSDEPDES